MPVSTGSLGEPRAKRCKHCDESSHRSDSSSGYWQLQLDRDLVETISAIYPEWFKSNMAEGGGQPPAAQRDSPPKAVVDTSPLLNSLEQNKESLKVKLMLRRPVEQLVAQGIMPPLKTPAAFHGQRRQLERAKTGDLLKMKIQQRPSRVELENRHILEADPHVDPSLAEKQRMLKKARLADQLNDQLSHRPGPLELIQKNILHTEEPIENAVKAGQIPYKATCEGQLNRPQHPLSYVNPEDDSQSSEDNSGGGGGGVDVLETAAKSAGIVVSLIPTGETAVVVTSDSSGELFADLCRPLIQQASSPASLVSSTSTLSPLSSIASPVPSQPATPASLPRSLQSPARCDAPGKDKNRKKSKSKAASKPRPIKFHEYKGPPSAQKNNVSNIPGNTESSYDLLLQQQTLLLQFQLQLQHKYPQIILPQHKTPSEPQPSITASAPSPAPSTTSESSSVPPTPRLLGRLEDMKVSDLKAELKRRSLPVSGSKPQLIERLKPYTSGSIDGGSVIDDCSSRNSPPQLQEVGSPLGPAEEQGVATEHMDVVEAHSPAGTQQQVVQAQVQLQQPEQQVIKSQEDLVREQQRQIEELQRELTLSQLKLQAATRAEPKAQYLALQKHLQARNQQNQMIFQINQLKALQAQRTNEEQQKLQEEQQKLQQEQHVAFQNQKNLTGSLVLSGAIDGGVVFVQQERVVENGFVEVKPPPVYDEVVGKFGKEKKSSVKSQIVDDVLEILIKNGELPPSAAQDPATPVTPGKAQEAPIFPLINNNTEVMPETTLDLEPYNLDTLDMDFTQLYDLAPNNNTIIQTEDSIPMDTDDWLESLLPSEDIQPQHQQQHQQQQIMDNHHNQYDPLLTIPQEPFDPFGLDDLRAPPDLSPFLWDKVDFAA